MDKLELQKLRDLPIEGVAERLGLRVERHKSLCPFPDVHQRPSTTPANVVPLHRLKNRGARAYICRLPEPTLAHSREQHVQAPEAAKTRQKRQKSNPIVQHLNA